MTAVGVDGGGTGGRAWVGPLDEDGTPAGRGAVDRPCNPYAVGADAAADAVVAAIVAAWTDAGRPAGGWGEAWVCAGLAGVDRPEDGAAMRAALVARGVHAERLQLIADPWVALEGALPARDPEDDPRVLLVAGTGSVAVGVVGTRRVRVGGWGARVGDEGSGAWLGIEAVRATLQALDGRTDAGPLAEAIQAAWGAGPEALVGRARDASSGAFGELAPLVLAQADDDPAAAALRARAAAHLADLVATAAARLGRTPAAWALVGGVARALEDEVVALLDPALGAALRPAQGPPVAGALAFATRAAERGV
ncbi:MAG: BadF/BadG/BcrA/BcrD ATPase family protein [Trueperaceae bacterium]|nr:BadF/BadG/BcrA/BcrD ATPase family protein [Trueperaceae bacterium]